MTSQLFLNDAIDSNLDTNPYLSFFMDSIGKGPGKYYTGIGQVYSATPRYQKGYGYLGTSYAPPSFNHGTGIGSALMSMFRMAVPLLKRGVQKLGTEAVDVASKIATDAIKGKNIKESAIQHASEKSAELMKQLPKAFSGIINKTPQEVAIPPSNSPPTAEATPTLAPRKRQLKRPSYIGKLKKYPALKYL